MQSTGSSIKVYIRVRPLIALEQHSSNALTVTNRNSIIISLDAISQVETTFDLIFPATLSQRQIYSHFQECIPELLKGGNITIFAYGQTGSGKTYTMFGNDWEREVEKNSGDVRKQQTIIENIEQDENSAGIIPRAIHQIFTQRTPTTKIFCSFMQIYNEKIYDLLAEQNKPLSIHESKAEGIFVEGLVEFQVTKFEDCFELMRKGKHNRHTRQTSMNTKSSRSHTIFQLLLEDAVKSRLNLCDLAGSEKINKKENMSEEHLEELKNINLSLTTLGKVIASLGGDNKRNVATFRESKLTRLLQESLTNNKFTFIVGNISPSSNNVDETMSTFKFVERARHITMKTKPINSSDVVAKLQQQLEHLRTVMAKNSPEDRQISEEQFSRILQQNKRMREELSQMQRLMQSNTPSSYSNSPQMTYYMPSDQESEHQQFSGRRQSRLQAAGESIAFNKNSPFKEEKSKMIKKLQVLEEKKRRYQSEGIEEIEKQIGTFKAGKKLEPKESSLVKGSKKKPDYRDKIKQLEAKLYGK